MKPKICGGILYVRREPVTMDAVKGFFKVCRMFTQVSVPFGALHDYVSESEDVVCTASSFLESSLFLS